MSACNSETTSDEEEFVSHRKLYKSEKIGFFTEQMDLSEKEAQKFWPIYNHYERRRDSLWRTQRRFLIQYNENKLDYSSGSEALTKFLEFEKGREQVREEYISKLRSFMSDEEILQMLYTEHQFKHFILNRIRGRHGMERGRGRGFGRGRDRGGNGPESPRPMVNPSTLQHSLPCE